jgi:hypothetical protein
MYFIVSCLFNLCWILIEFMVRQGIEQCRGGPPFPYIESYNHLDILHEARDINYGPRLKKFIFIKEW